MLEPLTLLSAISAAAQLVDFGGKILSGSHELYHSVTGLSEENSLRELVAEEVKSFFENIDKVDHQIARDMASAPILQPVDSLMMSCNDLVVQLVQLLDSIKVKGDGGRIWNSVKQAKRSLRREKKLQNISTRITKIQSLIDSHLLLSQVCVDSQTLLEM